MKLAILRMNVMRNIILGLVWKKQLMNINIKKDKTTS